MHNLIVAEHVFAKNTGKEMIVVHIMVFVTKNVAQANAMALLLETVIHA